LEQRDSLSLSPKKKGDPSLSKVDQIRSSDEGHIYCAGRPVHRFIQRNRGQIEIELQDPERGASLPVFKEAPELEIYPFSSLLPAEGPLMGVLQPATTQLLDRATTKVTKEKKRSTNARFVAWCQARGFTKANMLDYLAERNRSKADALAEKTHLTTTLLQTRGVDWSQDRLFKNLANALRIDNPKSAKYEEMWDIKVLWECLKFPLFEKKPDIEARTRANILVRLATAGRNGDVCNILRESVTFFATRVEFQYFQWKTKTRDAT
jgi:hypothetical protein